MEVSKINFYSSMRAQSPRIRVLAKNKQYLCKENTQSVSFPRKITPLYFTPNFNGLTAKTKDVLKNQQKSFEYDIAPADVFITVPVIPTLLSFGIIIPSIPRASQVLIIAPKLCGSSR